MVTVRRRGAVSALHRRFDVIEQPGALTALDNPAGSVEHGVAQLVGQGAEGQQFAETFTHGRDGHHRGVGHSGVEFTDAEYVVALLVMHGVVGADLQREVDAVDLQAGDLLQRVERNGIDAVRDQLLARGRGDAFDLNMLDVQGALSVAAPVVESQYRC